MLKFDGVGGRSLKPRVRAVKTLDVKAVESLFGAYWKVDVDHLAETKNPEAIFVVAEEKEGRTWRVVGAALAYIRQWNRTAYLAEFAVAEDSTRRGVGTAMLNALARRARKRRLRAIIAETQPTNARALAFYERNGMVMCGIDERYYTNRPEGLRHVAIFFSLDLE